MIYPYLCKDCNKYFEVSMTIHEYNSQDMVCPHCTSANVKRTYKTPTTVIYNGEGFTKSVKEE